MIISVALFGFFLFTMRPISFAEWTWEQRAMGIMIAALVSYNSKHLCIILVIITDPFYGLVFAVSGWFFPFINALFTDMFLCSILLFWLLITDKIRYLLYLFSRMILKA